MSIAIVGWTGLVGQNLINQLPSSAHLYNSRNINDLIGKSYDTLYFAAMPAEKWRINKDPQSDYNTLITLQGILKTVSIGTFILISTVDVFDCTISQTETGTAYAEHPYGKHRRELEEFVQTNFSNSYIIRLPGLFGWGLKKNALYDLIHNNQVANICPESKFQWYFLDNLVEDISACINSGYRCIQLVSEPITMYAIIESFFPDRLCQCTSKTSVIYNLTTRHGRDGSNYWISATNILEKIAKFIKRETTLLNLPYSLAISNIAWNDEDCLDIYKVLRTYHISSVELAPTKICKWTNWKENIPRIKQERAVIIPYRSCQSILYDTTINIFEHSDEFLKHYEYVCHICRELDISRIVFGSPKSRHLVEGKDPVDIFKKIGEISAKYGIICCIEPNSTKYGCTWLTRLDQAVEFVKAVEHSSIMINFDFGNYYMEEDNSNVIDAMPYIAHIQISLPFLQEFNSIDDKIYTEYVSLLTYINEYKYAYTISLEMNQSSINNLCKSVKLYIDTLFIYLK